MTGKHWTEAEDRLVARSTSVHTAQIAAVLGRTSLAINCRRRALQHGTTARQRHGAAGVTRDWTAEELAYLDRHIGADTIPEIAQALGRTPNAVKVKAMRRGLHQTRPNPQAAHHPGCSARQVARLLGMVGSEKTVAWWIQQGWLPAQQTVGAGKHRRWRIAGPDLADFLRTYRWLYDPQRIQDRGWRAFVASLPPEEYLTTGQVAPLLYLANATCVTQAIYRGDLFAVKRGNNWLVPRSAVRRYVPPPCGGGKTPPELAERRRQTLALMGGGVRHERHNRKPVPLDATPGSEDSGNRRPRRPRAIGQEQGPHTLTAQQRFIVRLTWLGLTDRQIGQLVGRSRKAVVNQFQTIYRRLGVRGRTDPRTAAAVALWLAERRQAAAQEEQAA